MELLFAAIGLAVLLSWEKFFSGPGKQPILICLRQCLSEGLDLFWQAVLLILIRRFLLDRGFLNLYRLETSLFFYFVLPYGINRAQKRRGCFYLSVFIGCLLIDDFYPSVSFLMLLAKTAEWAALLTAFQTAMIGLRWRLFLNPSQGILGNASLVFFAAGLLALSFSAFLK